MSHPRLAVLQAFADSELPERRRARTWSHLQHCAHCRAELAWLDQVREAATAATGITAPPHAWERIRARIEQGETVLLPLDPAAARPQTARRIAGAVALLAGAVGAAAIPGSPLRTWLVERSQPPPAAAPAADRVGTPVELEVAPSAGRVLVRLEGVRGAVRLRVRVSPSDVLAVRATGAAAEARFVSAPGRLVIADVAGGELLLSLPGGVPLVRVERDGTALVEKRGEAVRVLAPAADTVGTEFLLLIR